MGRGICGQKGVILGVKIVDFGGKIVYFGVCQIKVKNSTVQITV